MSAQGSAGRRVAFVQSSWHKDLVDRIRSSFVSEISQLGIAESRVDSFEVTGAFEIPLQAKRLAESGNYDAIVPSISGWARQHGINTLFVDSRDPFAHGFQVV